MTDEKTKTKNNAPGIEEEEDDFDFGNTTDESSEEGGEVGNDGEDKSDGDSAEKGKEGKSSKSDSDESDEGEETETGDDETGDESEEGDGEGSSESDADKKAGKSEKGSSKDDGDDGESSKEGEGDDEDLFASEFKEVNKDSESEKGSFDLKSLATEFEVEAETPEQLKTAIKEKIESAKKEIKLDGYSPDAQSIIKHLNDNDGKIDDFFNNKEIVSLQSVVGLNPNEKVLYVRTNELIRSGLSADKAAEQAEEELSELSTREIKDRADGIDNQAKELINVEVKKIVGDREALIAKERAKKEAVVKQEVDNLKNFVNSQDEFMGIKLSPVAKQNIVREIESGTFDEIANESPEKSKFTAYMLAKFGPKILDTYKKQASEQNRKGHNAAIDKSVSALHKTKDEAQSKKTGRQKSESGETKNFESWADPTLWEEDAG